MDNLAGTISDNDDDRVDENEVTKLGMIYYLYLSNELISRDERLYYVLECHLNSKFGNKLCDNCLPEIITVAVDIENDFVFEYIEYLKFDLILHDNGTNGNENGDC